MVNIRYHRVCIFDGQEVLGICMRKRLFNLFFCCFQHLTFGRRSFLGKIRNQFTIRPFNHSTLQLSYTVLREMRKSPKTKRKKETYHILTDNNECHRRHRVRLRCVQLRNVNPMCGVFSGRCEMQFLEKIRHPRRNSNVAHIRYKF